MILRNNCCDGIYNSFDVHFTSACDNKCAHCIDMRFHGINEKIPDIKAITDTIINNQEGLDDVLFLGGEPCLYLQELVDCIKILRAKTSLKLFVTTSIPKTCFDSQELFYELINLLDGINLSVQHHVETIADDIRQTTSMFDRQSFYMALPHKNKIRINLNIVKPYLYIRKDISDCIYHYDKMGFNSIKLSEIQHGKDMYVSFANLFNIKMKSAYAHGCQTDLNTQKIFPGINTLILLKRSCFLCEASLHASLMDGIKSVAKIFMKPKNKYGVVYENGKLEKGWI